MTKAEAKQLHENGLNEKRRSNFGVNGELNVFFCNLGLMISLLFSRGS